MCSEIRAGSHGSSQIAWDIVFDNFGAGGIKTHSKTPQNPKVKNPKMGSRFAAADTRPKEGIPKIPKSEIPKWVPALRQPTLAERL